MKRFVHDSSMVSIPPTNGICNLTICLFIFYQYVQSFDLWSFKHLYAFFGAKY